MKTRSETRTVDETNHQLFSVQADRAVFIAVVIDSFSFFDCFYDYKPTLYRIMFVSKRFP